MALAPYALTNVDGVKAHIDQTMDGRDDDLIEALINAFSSYAQGQWGCNRQFEIKSRTKDVSGPVYRIFLDAAPVVVDDSLQLWDDPDREFTDEDLRLTYGSAFDINPETGIIRMHDECLSRGVKNIRVIYTAGLFPANRLDLVPPDLKAACEMQVVWWFKRRDNYGTRSVDGQLGVTNYFNPTDILPIVRQTLQANRLFR